VAGHRVTFGPFQLDLERRTLIHNHLPLKLGSRALDVLCVLASAGGEVVSKEQLMTQVWPDLVVEENNLQVHISAVRKALEEGSGGDSFVVTVPGRGYRLIGLQSVGAVEPQSTDNAARPTVPGTSIAILPFSNISGDAEQDYFADGIVEDIITGLSRISWLFVIARNSSFVFRDKDPDLRRTGRDLGCRYLVQGSVRKAGNRIRITAQLVESENGVCLWAERYDRLLDDIFVVQDDIAMNLIGVIEPNLRKIEIERVRRKRPESLDAYDLVLRALSIMGNFMPAGADQAIPLLQKAVKLEPDYAAAHAYLARCFHFRYSRGGLRQADREVSVHHARAALRGGDDATALATAALVIWFDDNDVATAVDVFERALAISSSNVVALGNSAFAYAWMGKTVLAIERARLALRLSPFDTLLPYLALAIAEYSDGRYREALDAARRAVESNPQFSVPRILLTVALVRLDRLDEARAEANQLLVLDPGFTMQAWAATVGKNPEVFERFADAWKKLGMLD
jgi:TolB-like protein